MWEKAYMEKIKKVEEMVMNRTGSHAVPGHDDIWA